VPRLKLKKDHDQHTRPSLAHTEKKKATHEDQASQEIQPQRRSKRDDDISKDWILEERAKGDTALRIPRNRLDTLDCQKEGGEL
jgi:hypothetical protein